MTAGGGAQVYDVIGPSDALVDRVSLPAASALLGVSGGVALLRLRTAHGPALATVRLH